MTPEEFRRERSRLYEEANNIAREGEKLRNEAESYAASKGFKDLRSPHEWFSSKPTYDEQTVWSKLSSAARINATLKEAQRFSSIQIPNIDLYVEKFSSQADWWRWQFAHDRRFYDAWNNRRTFGINSNIPAAERNAYKAGAYYADNYIGNLSSPFLYLPGLSGDGVGNRADTQFEASYWIMKSGNKNARILAGIANEPAKILVLNDPKKADEFLHRRKQLKDRERKKDEDLESLQEYASLYKVEEEENKVLLKDLDKRLMSNINTLRAEVYKELQNQNKLFDDLSVSQKKDKDTIAAFKEKLMENSKLEISLQEDINKLNSEAKGQEKTVEKLIKRFETLQNLYELSSKELKHNESALSKVTEQIVDFNIETDKKFKSLNQTVIEGESKLGGEIEELRRNLKDQVEVFKLQRLYYEFAIFLIIFVIIILY